MQAGSHMRICLPACLLPLPIVEMHTREQTSEKMGRPTADQHTRRMPPEMSKKSPIKEKDSQAQNRLEQIP